VAYWGDGIGKAKRSGSFLCSYSIVPDIGRVLMAKAADGSGNDGNLGSIAGALHTGFSPRILTATHF
jgi:hypothetical protein